MKNKKINLDSEEQQLLDDFDAGEFRSLRNRKAEILQLEEAATNTLKKDKRINIRISNHDLERLQMRAAREGVPYQTYISGALHKLVSGRLREVSE